MSVRKRVWRTWTVLAILPSALLFGCGDDDNAPQVDPVVEKLDAGWALFSAGDYEGAIGKFQDAVDLNRGLGDGYNGIGWSCVRLDSLNAALDNFNIAVAKGFVGADAQAGRCIVLNRIDEYRQCIFAGDAVLSVDDRFELEADKTLDVRDVRLAMAQSHLALKEYIDALDQITTVDSAILISPNSATFVQELVTAVEKLAIDLSVQ